MHDSTPQRDPATPTEWWIFGIGLTVILGLFAAEIFHDYTPVKLSAFLVVLFWIPLLVFHEAGHAVVSYLLGWHVGQIVIGMGRTIGRFRLWTASIEIRVFPIEGFVSSVPTKLNWPHVENALIYFAGPGVELLLALGILFVVGPDRLLSKSDDYWLIFWQSLALAATTQGVLNLIPLMVRTQSGEVPNDGLGIILSLLRPTSYYAAMIGLTYNEVDHVWETRDSTERKGRERH